MPDTTLQLAGDAAAGLRAALHAELADLELVPYVSPEAAAEPARRLVRRTADLGDEALLRRARLVHADVIGRQGDVAGAGSIVREVNLWATAHAHGPLQARSERLLSSFYSRIGDMATALEHAVRSVELLPADAAPRLRADHLMTLALGYARVGAFTDARERFRPIFAIADQVGDVELRIAAMNNLAYVEYWAGDHEASLAVAEQMRALGDQEGIALDTLFLDTLARAQLSLGRYADAFGTLAPVAGEAVADDASSALHSEPESLAEILLTLAECQRMVEAYADAQVSLERAAVLCDERDLEGVRVRVEQEQAQLFAAQGRFAEAYETHVAFHAAHEAMYSTEREARARILATVFETEEAVRTSRQFRELSIRDALTGLYNRRYVDDHAPQLLAAGRGTFSMAIVDLDFFKAVNDRLSHDHGDAVLRGLAPLLEAHAPDDGFVARLGGEEFVLVLPGLSPEAALAVCEGLRAAVEAHPWHQLVGAIPVTVSIGLTSTPDATRTWSSLLAQADRQLYAAKRAGRNRVAAG
jgi:two-component system cell cycle response regulator